jgi:hypothetical protein
MLFTILPLFSYVYYLLLQTYVLKLEIIVNLIGALLLGLELIISLLAIITVSLHEKAI